MADAGREADLASLRREWHQASPAQRREIERTAQVIQKEQMDNSKRSMRESLIREMRNGNAGNVRDIQEEARKKSKYRNDD